MLIYLKRNLKKANKHLFQRKKKKTRAKNQTQTRINRIENEKFTDITSEEAAKDEDSIKDSKENKRKK